MQWLSAETTGHGRAIGTRAKHATTTTTTTITTTKGLLLCAESRHTAAHWHSTATEALLLRAETASAVTTRRRGTIGTRAKTRTTKRLKLWLWLLLLLSSAKGRGSTLKSRTTRCGKGTRLLLLLLPATTGHSRLSTSKAGTTETACTQRGGSLLLHYGSRAQAKWLLSQGRSRETASLLLLLETTRGSDHHRCLRKHWFMVDAILHHMFVHLSE